MRDFFVKINFGKIFPCLFLLSWKKTHPKTMQFILILLQHRIKKSHPDTNKLHWQIQSVFLLWNVTLLCSAPGFHDLHETPLNWATDEQTPLKLIEIKSVVTFRMEIQPCRIDKKITLLTQHRIWKSHSAPPVSCLTNRKHSTIGT